MELSHVHVAPKGSFPDLERKQNFQWPFWADKARVSPSLKQQKIRKHTWASLSYQDFASDLESRRPEDASVIRAGGEFFQTPHLGAHRSTSGKCWPGCRGLLTRENKWCLSLHSMENSPCPALVTDRPVDEARGSLPALANSGSVFPLSFLHGVLLAKMTAKQS